MKKNFSTLIREEMVSRFDQVVKDEIRRSDLAIIEYKKSIDNLKFQLDNIVEESSYVKKDLFDIRILVVSTIKNEVCQLENHCNSQISSLNRSFKELIDSFSDCKNTVKDKISNQSFKISVDEINQRINEFEKKLDNLGKSVRQEIHHSIENVLGITDQIASSMSIYLGKANDNLLNLKSIVDEYKVDSSGVLRELQIYKKSMFIIEKKIENIYKKIEKLEGVCLKPD